MPTEIWKAPLDPQLDRYMVSNLGRVRNENSRKILTPSRKGNNKAFCVTLKTSGGFPTSTLLPKMVYEAFSGKLAPSRTLWGYRDGNMRNCAYENLYFLPDQTQPNTPTEHYVRHYPTLKDLYLAIMKEIMKESYDTIWGNHGQVG